SGGDGDDTLIGGNGDDTLVGGAGADMMTGGLGNDRYFVDNPADVVVEAAGEGSDTVLSSATSYALSANVENLWFSATGDVTGTGNSLAYVITGRGGNDTLQGRGATLLRAGGDGDDPLVGGDGDDTLVGGAGDDTMAGGLGNDRYFVDSASDVIVENADEGNDVVFSEATSYALSANVENLWFTATGDVTGIGNDLRNVITAQGGNDSLQGGGGNDELYGNAGNDRLEGGA